MKEIGFIPGAEGLENAILNRYLPQDSLEHGEILDIGCGAGFFRPPELCRELHVAGYRVFGINIDPSLRSEDFPHRVVDITDSIALRALGENRFSIAHERGVTEPSNPDPSLEHYVGEEEWPNFVEKFQNDVAHILTVGGFYIQTGCDVIVYQKQANGTLMRVSR